MKQSCPGTVKSSKIISAHKFIHSILFSGLLASINLQAQVNQCTYFPMEVGSTWQYTNQINSDTLTSAITDTATINEKVCYCFTPYNPDSRYSRYWLRPEPDRIYALNIDDSTEYILFDFSAETGQSWIIPPVYKPLNVPLNQCDWGSAVTRMTHIDTVFNPARMFFNVHHFAHLDHPCYDAGIASTFFKRDFGIIYFSQVTEGDVLDWNLIVEPPDTVSLDGIYTIIGNPCLTVPCLPGVVGSLKSGDTIYVLTHGDLPYRDGELFWNEYSPAMGDSIAVTGIFTKRIDNLDNEYYTIDLIDLQPAIPTIINEADQINSVFGNQLYQNYPNPFNPETIIEYSLFEPGIVKLRLFNASGKTIRSQSEGFQKPGHYSIKFDGKDLPSGIYYYQLTMGRTTRTKPMILLK